MKDKEQIQKIIDRTTNMIEAGDTFSGMTYTEGVRNALEWVLEDDNTAYSPID